MKQTSKTQTLVLAALMLALALVLPFLTGQIPQVGSMLLPMHLPVLLCGLLCGWPYGMAVGFLAPLLRYVLFGMPPLLPTGIAMCFELAVYGGVSGFLYSRSPWKCLLSLYRALLGAMVSGRIVWGLVQLVLTKLLAGHTFSWQLFFSGAFLTAIPGIILQLVLIPALMLALGRTGMIPFSRSRREAPQT